MTKRYFLLIFAVICGQISFFIHESSIFNNQLWAQFTPPDVKSIPLPTGSGARALGLGGAFIAVADDATAASWNPAGLIRLERPEASIVGSYLLADQDFSAGNSGLGNMLDNEDVGRWDVNFLSIAYPFRFLRKNFVAALNYHQILDFHQDISLNQRTNRRKTAREDSLFFNNKVDFKSSGGIGALSPGIAMLLFPKLSFGLTVNIFDDEFFNSHGWTETTSVSGNGFSKGIPVSTSFRKKTSSRDYHGVNVTLGMMWDVWEREDKFLTFGAVFHSPYTARFDERTKGFTQVTLGGIEGDLFSFSEKSRIKVDWPMSAGIGFGFRYTDALSFSLDVTWTDWSEWVQKTKTGDIPPINTRPIGGGSEHDEIDDTYAVRFGTEYLMFREKEVIAFRGGLFYEPRPSLGTPSEFDRNGNPIDFNGDPTDVWGFSLGVGVTTKRFSLDAAYQFRYVRDMEGRDIGLPGTEFDTIENLFLTSLIVYF
ncbi:MAG: OmpP1/FadL family transporter [Candidatus Anammoxibacter sp.]